ncbi:MAG: efflux RND transporter periplasmic adaptor subunit [Myxococcaceae bacterium]
MRRLLAWGAPLAALVLALHGCSKPEAQGPRAAPPAPVMVGKVVQKAMPEQVAAVGNVTPVSTVAVRPLVSGVIDKVEFKEGTEVKKDQVLFLIDPRPAKAALAAAESALVRDRAQAERARADVKRYGELVQKQYVTTQQFEAAKASSEALDATVKVDEAAVMKARLDLAYCTLRAPVDGRTGSLAVQVGNLAQPAAPNALVTITQLRPIYVSFSVPEGLLPKLRAAKDGVKVVAQAPGDAASHEGIITFIDNSVNTQTGTILLKATFANEDEALWPGQFVNVTATLGQRPKALVVPATSVQRGQQGSFVYVVKADDTVELRPVVVGPFDDSEAIIEQGLSAGETVVTEGQLRVVPGAKVQVKNKEPAGS